VVYSEQRGIVIYY